MPGDSPRRSQAKPHPASTGDKKPGSPARDARSRGQRLTSAPQPRSTPPPPPPPPPSQASVGRGVRTNAPQSAQRSQGDPGPSRVGSGRVPEEDPQSALRLQHADACARFQKAENELVALNICKEGQDPVQVLEYFEWLLNEIAYWRNRVQQLEQALEGGAGFSGDNFTPGGSGAAGGSKPT